MNQLRLMWGGVWRNPARTLLTFASLCTAFLLFGLLSGVNRGLERVAQRFRTDRLYIMNSDSMFGPVVLPLVIPSLQRMPEIQDFAYWAYFVGYYRTPEVQLPVVAADVERIFRIYPELRIADADLRTMSRVKAGAVVSRSLANRFHWRVGDRVPLKSALWPRKDGSDSWPFVIVGIYDPVEAAPSLSDLLFVNLSYFDDSRAFGAGAVNLVIAKVRRASMAANTASSIDATFASSPLRTRTRTENAYAALQWRQLRDTRRITDAIVGAVVFTLLVVTASTLSHSVGRRSAEFATLRALGFSRARITMLILGEAMLLCLPACLAGLSLCLLVFPWMARRFGAMTLDPSVLVLGATLSAMVAALGTLVPAYRIGRRDIAAALADR